MNVTLDRQGHQVGMTVSRTARTPGSRGQSTYERYTCAQDTSRAQIRPATLRYLRACELRASRAAVKSI
jgi:hypothetical protein